MADSQSLKKNKKKKKKGGSSNQNPLTTAPTPHTATNGIDESITKTNSSISKNLPQKFAAAMFKDVEVTMSKCEVKTDDVVPAVSSKKSKKKKSKKSTEAPAKENASTGLLSFNENRIELVNHPEISVTLSKAPEVEGNQLQNSEKVTLLEEKPVEENTTAPAAKKKKKKKKKKKVTSDVPETVDTTEDNAYASPSPTYVKLPASGDSLVLVVSHESFSNGSKSSNNNGADKGKVIQNGVASVLPQNKKLTNNVANKNISTFSSNFQQGNTVKIFPVPSNTGEESISNNKQSLPNSNPIGKKVDPPVDNPKSNPSSEPVVSSEPDATKTKAQLKAERRAIQEAQRAAKAKSKEKEVQSVPLPADSKSDPVSKEASVKKVGNPKTDPEKEKLKLVVKDVIHKVRLFSHLPKCKAFENLNDTHSQIHSAILEVGYQYSKGIICGSNARCIALLAALRKAINESTIIPDKDFLRSLETKLQVYLNFLSSCRPLSVSMINAVKFLKHQMNHLPKEMSGIKIKENLSSFIYNFVNEEILLAKEAIGDSASAKIVNGDVILVFAYSSLVKDVLCKAHNQDKVFRVIVVDSRPKMEGLKMLRCLVKQGLHCSYISISAISYVMKEVSKVIIGAHALLSNGCVMSRLGCKQVALVASSYSVPVLVCCETYKFCERVLTDSFVHNELGETEKLLTSNHVQSDCLKNLNDLHSLQLLNLLYDVTPPDLISMVITEKGVLPCTSVPVVLRVRHAGLHE